MALLNLVIDTATGGFATGAAGLPGVDQGVLDCVVNDSQTGTTFKDVGVVYLEAGTILAASSFVWIGVDNAFDGAELELRDAVSATLLATITKTGLVGSASPSSDIVVTVEGFYALRLRATDVAATAFIGGIHLQYEGGAAALLLDTTFSPVGLWSLNGDLLDGSGNGLDLTMAVGTAYYGPAPVTDDEAIFFQGARAQRPGADTEFQIYGALTVEMLIAPSGVATAVQILTQYGGTLETGATNVLFQVSLESGNRVRYLHEYSAGTDAVIIFPVHVPVGQWTLLTITRDSAGTGVKLYLNGIERGSTTLANAPTGGTTAQLTVGGFISGGFTFTGQMSSLKVIAAELTAPQVLQEAYRCLPPELRP